MNRYQVTFNPDGTIASTTLLPPEPPKPRIIFVREASEHAARQVARILYSTAQ